MNKENCNITAIKDRLFYLSCIYLLLDYGRLHDILSIGFLRPLMIITILLILNIVISGFRNITWLDQIKFYTAFLLLLAIHVPFAHNNYLAFATTRNMFLFFPFLLAISFSIYNFRKLKLFIDFLLVLMIWVSAYALMHGGIGPGNYFNDENDLALYINCWLPFPYFLFLVEKNFNKKIFYLLCVLIGVLAVVASFSRGGFIGLACMLIVAWMVSSKKIVSLLLVGALALAVYYFGGKKYMDEMSTISDVHGGTAQERLLSWEAAWNMFLDNPLGVGGNNFQVLFPRYQPPEMKRGMYGRVAHSLWFTLLPELGIPGVLIFFLLLWRNIKDIWFLKKMSKVAAEGEYFRALSFAFIASFAGFFSSATFLSVLYYPHYWYLTGLIVATYNLFQTASINKLSG